MQSQQFIGGNICLAKAGLTGLSGAATTYTTAAALLFAITGKAYTKAAAAGAATPTTDFNTGNPITVVPGKGTNVTWCVDATGAVRCIQGSSELLDASGNFQFAPPQFSDNVPDSLVPFAYTVHKNLAAGALFTFGVSQWSQANTVHSVNDIIAIPNRPQVS